MMSLTQIIFFAGILNAFEDSAKTEHLVEFRLVYPLITTKNFSEGGINYSTNHSGRNGLGLALSYYFYRWSRFGFLFEPSAWFMPVKIGGVKVKAGGVTISSGIVFRPLPETIIDPTLTTQVGVGLFDSGAAIQATFTVPVQTRLSLNVFKDSDFFGDKSLALAVSAGAGYYIDVIHSLEPWIYDLGLGIRGSF